MWRNPTGKLTPDDELTAGAVTILGLFTWAHHTTMGSPYHPESNYTKRQIFLDLGVYED
jgi:hypothetical protein